MLRQRVQKPRKVNQEFHTSPQKASNKYLVPAIAILGIITLVIIVYYLSLGSSEQAANLSSTNLKETKEVRQKDPHMKHISPEEIGARYNLKEQFQKKKQQFEEDDELKVLRGDGNLQHHFNSRIRELKKNRLEIEKNLLSGDAIPPRPDFRNMDRDELREKLRQAKGLRGGQYRDDLYQLQGKGKPRLARGSNVLDGLDLERKLGVDLSDLDTSRFNVMKPKVRVLDDPDTRVPDEDDIESCPNLCQEWFDGCNKCLCNFGRTAHCTQKQCDNEQLQVNMCIKWKKEAFDRGLVSKIPRAQYNDDQAGYLKQHGQSLRLNPDAPQGERIFDANKKIKRQNKGCVDKISDRVCKAAFENDECEPLKDVCRKTCGYCD